MPRKTSATESQTAAVETVATPATVASTPAKAPKAPKQSKVKAEEAAVVAAPAVAATEPPKKRAKTEAKAAAAPVVAAVQVTETAATSDAPAAVEADASVTTECTDFFSKLQQVSTLLAGLKTEFRSLEKKLSRELKTATKQSKRKRKTGNRSPSGFVKPTLISDDLAVFLGKPTGSQMARTEVTREINAYIRANSLQDKANGRKINADARLSALLKLDASKEELTYFNLQRYMSPHFAKTAVVA